LLHQGEGAGHRMIRRDEIEPVLTSLLLEGVNVQVGRGGFVVRFRASSASHPATNGADRASDAVARSAGET
jgi:hypothetical protein